MEVYHILPLFARPSLPSLSLLFGTHQEGEEEGEHHRRRDAAGGGGKAALEYAEKSIGGDSLLHPLGKTIAKACEGDSCPRAASLHLRLINTDGVEDDTCHHIAGLNAGGGQVGAVNEDLPHGAEYAAAEKTP